jgi:serine/threonine protein kinase
MCSPIVKTDATPDISPGTLVGGKYRLGDLLGEGGMGSVYDGVNEAIGLRVALKILHPEYGRKPRVVKRFKREARAAASIGHANICEVIDTGATHSGVPFLVMPKLEGITLGALLTQNKKISHARIIDIGVQTLSGLQAAHDAGIVHRDLKPENIFLTTLGDRTDFVKILDFGISKIVGAELDDALTKTGASMGTPYYMSPEQAMDSKEVDHRTDIWAVGVILYEATVGDRPFDGSSLPAIVHRICHAPIEPPEVRSRAVSPALSAVVMKALSRDLSVRYQSAAKMREALLSGTALNQSRQKRLGIAAAALVVMGGLSWMVDLQRDPHHRVDQSDAAVQSVASVKTADREAKMPVATPLKRLEVDETDTNTDTDTDRASFSGTEGIPANAGQSSVSPATPKDVRKKNRARNKKTDTRDVFAVPSQALEPDTPAEEAGGIKIDLNNPYESHQP